MLAAIARGDINSRHLQAALRGESPVALAAPAAATVRAPHRATTATQGILIVGVDRLLTVPAKCCRPIPPDAIVGFVSKGRGVSVHRSSCRNLARLSAERLIEATWGTGKDNGHYTVEVMAECDLSVPPVREALELLAREQVRVIASRTESIDQRSRMSITLDVRNAAQLAALVKALSSLPGVNSAKRA
jgi:GTP pyrophosphokinase